MSKSALLSPTPFGRILTAMVTPFDENGRVDPLELGIQEWQDGRLTSLMCGAYIYCQLSGPIPEEIELLTEIITFRLEYNYLSGFIPPVICDLGTNHLDYLAFDVTGNLLCPPYPQCIDTQNFWYQDTSSCSEIGDINNDTIINVQDIIILVSLHTGELMLLTKSLYKFSKICFFCSSE